jgi:hypothetical protein
VADASIQTGNLSATQAANLAALRDGERPPGDGGALAQELKEELELALAPIAGDRDPANALWLFKSRLNDVHGCEQRFVDIVEEPFVPSIPLVRGRLVHKAIELSTTAKGDLAPGELVAEAAALMVSKDDDIADFVAALSVGERAELEAEATSRVTAFADGFPPISKAWRPSTEMSIRFEVLDGRVVLSARPDLLLGHPEHDGKRGRVVVDLKTGATQRSHRDDLALYALVHTLALRIPPFRVATYYLETSRVDALDVTDDLLTAALRRVADGAAKVLALTTGQQEPTLNPGPACGWCARYDTCEGARRWDEERERRGL